MHFYLRCLRVTCLLVCLALPALSQTLVSGRVTGEQNDGIPGVTITIKGTNRGTTTDAGGLFQVNAATAETLVFSYVGYVTQEAVVNNRTTFAIKLAPDTRSLDEIVVVGYGTVKKSDLTGSVSTIKAEAIKEMPVVSVDQAIQSRAPGVQVTQSSAAPGGGISIRVRGANSINSGSEPLYVIDGFPMYPDNAAIGTSGNRQATNAMATINPNEIESIEILKDASATSIYGSRGSNGVVLITTKRGKEGQSRVDYEGSYSAQTIARNIDVLNGGDYARYLNILERSQGGSPRFTDAQISQIGAGTNWMDAISQTGGLSSHQLSFTGGNKAMRYAFVGNYLDNKGVIKNTFFNRYGFRLNLDNDFLNGRATLSNSWSFNRTGSSNVPTDRGGPGGIIITALGLDPTVPVYNQNGNYNYPSYDQRFNINPLAEAQEGYDRDNINRLFGTTALTINIVEGLKFRTSLGADLVNANRTTFYNSSTFTGRQYSRQLEKANRNVNSLLNENILSYNRQVAPGHNLDVTLGYTYQVESNLFTAAATRDLPSDDPLSVNMQNGSKPQIPTSGRQDWSLQSLLGRVNYNLKDRYLFTVTFRRDGSSKFGPNNKWATFPSGAIGWRLANEPFFVNSGLGKVFNDVKFRASYGLTGNSQIPVYRSLGGLVPFNYVLGSGLVAGYGPDRIANPDLKWESTTMLNLGLDVALLNNRLSMTFDVFSNKTTDLLLDVSIPQSTGFSTIMLNSGSLSNKGIEFSTNYKIINNKSFKWDISGNISLLRNKILDLGTSTPFFANSTSGHLGVFGSWVEAGNSIGVWKGYKYVGQFQTDEEGKSFAALAGYPKYEDVNGDGKYSADDYVIIGNPNPKFTWGFNSSVKFQNFDFSIFFRGVHGNDVRNLQQSEMGDGVQKINQVANILSDSWTPTNTGASRPIIDGRRDFISFRRSSFFIQDGSFVRLQNIALGYTLPVVSKYIRNARLYVSGQNLFLITKYKGFDPEVNNQGQNNLNRGDDYDAYPRARMMTVGVNLGI
ncbi:SusC/RagA family TonB-linked outer membrane protein [Spirosoma utsteinense]|uniref:TonB-linked SusC/RagA family outer membrane protein n=1 Tax=Spirosoma utsteinense TaxID=2585773 RepID=A0ABR6VZ63_9BACT|nr:TonB-dependent receptor [Spirosoma utsteinense]MBC3784640.1 TonB-linked SusC/RagA family outer membrane protein [Spirosoma utsteinense]MBC3789607.1 TonB-linked SusC/RagA family outer membrane protein [Spirosoma utsteinense]